MENSLSLSKFLTDLRKNLKLLILLPLIFILISALITMFLMKPKYEANTQVLVNQKEKNSELMAQEVQSNIQLVNTYSEVVKSPRILDEVAKKNDEFSSSDIKGMLTVTTQAQSQILNINVKSDSKNDAEKIANDISEVFSDKMPKIMNVNNVSVLSSADGTASKVSPSLILNLVIGLILGIILAIFIIIMKELFDKRIKKEEELEKEQQKHKLTINHIHQVYENYHVDSFPIEALDLFEKTSLTDKERKSINQEELESFIVKKLPKNKKREDVYRLYFLLWEREFYDLKHGLIPCAGPTYDEVQQNITLKDKIVEHEEKVKEEKLKRKERIRQSNLKDTLRRNILKRHENFNARVGVTEKDKIKFLEQK